MGFNSNISYNTLMEENHNLVAPTNDPQPPVSPPSQLNDENHPLIQSETVYIAWSAPEFIEHKKSSTWFATLVVVIVVVALAIFFISHSIFATVMIVLMGIAFAIIAVRHPRTVNYELTNQGVRSGNRFSSYIEFKSYSVIDEVEMGSIVFNPFKRFGFPTTLYY